MLSINRTVFVSAFLAGLAACGGNDSSESSAATPSLAGIWRSDCLSVDSGVWALATLTNTDAESKSEHTLYQTGSCVIPVRHDIALRTYSVTGQADGLAGAYKVDFTSVSSTVVFLTDEVVTEANKSSYLGYADWQNGVAKDTTGKAPSNGQEAAGTKFYTIIKIDGDAYRSGEMLSGKGDTEATRPTSLGTIVLKKQ